MCKRTLGTIFFIFVASSIINAQNKEYHLGLTSAVNYGKYRSNNQSANFNYELGFSAGGFINYTLSDNLGLQTEVLFSLYRINNVQDIFVTDINGDPFPGSFNYDFEYTINEYRIDVPILLKSYVAEKIFLNAGLQVGFILDQQLSSSNQLLSGTGQEIVVNDHDVFDFGLLLGFGVDLTSKLDIYSRFYYGILERDNSVKSILFSLGIHYSLN